MMPRILLLVALVALFAVMLDLFGHDAGLSTGVARSSETTGYYLRDAVVTEYGADGGVRIQMSARSATEDPARQVISLEDVQVDYQALPERRWRLTALRGQAEPGLHTVTLEDDVVMSAERQSLPTPAVIRTAKLVLDTETQRARTEEPVTLGFGDYSVAATGMMMDLKAETLRLESGVHGHFLP